MFRIFLILASSFFLIFSVLFGFIFIDGVIFNSVMILINIFYCINLILPHIDVSLTKFQQKIYENVFSKNIDKRTFKVILENSIIEPKLENHYLVQQGDVFKGPILIAQLKKSHHLIVKKDNDVIFIQKNPYHWFGLIENEQTRKNKDTNYKWPVSIYVETNPDYNKSLDNEEVDKRYPEAVQMISFESKNLEKLYERDDGIKIRNALHSVWLNGISEIALETNVKVKKIIGAKLEEGKNNKELDKSYGNTNIEIINEEKEKSKGIFERIVDTVENAYDNNFNNTEEKLIPSEKESDKLNSKQNISQKTIKNNHQDKINNSEYEDYEESGFDLKDHNNI